MKRPSSRPEGRIRTVPGLLDLFGDAGLDAVEARETEIECAFESFDDYWSALQKDEVDAMSEPEVARVKATLQEIVPPDTNGAIRYAAALRNAPGNSFSRVILA